MNSIPDHIVAAQVADADGRDLVLPVVVRVQAEVIHHLAGKLDLTGNYAKHHPVAWNKTIVYQSLSRKVEKWLNKDNAL